MKKPWIIVIAIVVIGVLALGGWRATSFVMGLFDNLLAQSRQVATLSDEAASAVTAQWDPQSLKPFATPDYFAAQEENSFAAWKTYQMLGKPASIKPCTVPSLNITNGHGTASAVCAATFTTGEGQITFDFDNGTGDWKIAGFKVAF